MTSLVVFVKYVINPHGMTMDKEQIQSIEDGKQSQLWIMYQAFID